MDYYIWGTGRYAVHMLRSYRGKLKINGFIDSNRTADFWGYKVFKPCIIEELDSNNVTIVIAIKNDRKQIVEVLDNLNIKYVYLQNFLDNELFLDVHESQEAGLSVENIICDLRQKSVGKKVMLLYGNCQIYYYNYALLNTPEFIEKYYLIRLDAVFEIGQGKEVLVKEFLELVDYFIYMHVSENNKYGLELSSDHIIKMLRNNAVKICIPDLYFKGYYPWIGQAIYNCKDEVIGFDDEIINQCIADKMDENDIINRLMDENLFSKDYCEKAWTESLLEIEKRESYFDIKILDFFNEQLRKEQLFYMQHHATNRVQKYVLDNLLKLICEDITANWVGVEENDSIYFPILPSVSKNNNLKFVDDRSKVMQYVRRYITYTKSNEI